MRRILILCLLLFSLVQPVHASETKYVALTFDDGPSGKFTQRLLDGLQDRGAKATFLLCGYRMQQYPELTQRIFGEGHEIGLHGFTHDSMENMSRRTVAAELMETEKLLPEGCRPVLLRPPGGFVTDGVRQVAEARNLAVLRWSVDPRDWAGLTVGQIETAVFRQVTDGDIILLHDMSYTSVQAALDIVDTLQEQGYEFVTVSELAKLRSTPLKPGTVYEKFPPE